MAGRDERRDRDLDDWFDEPKPPPARRARPRQTRAEAETPTSATQSGGEDWLGGDMRPARRPRAGLPGPLSEPRLAIAAVAALVVLLVVGLALGGVFSSSTPRRAATTVITHPVTTTATTTRTQTQTVGIAAPSVPLKPGDQGPAVKVLQRALASLGYPPGTIDGTYGPSTQRAVARFQAASNLTPDGVLGPQTLAALRAALKAH